MQYVIQNPTSRTIPAILDLSVQVGTDASSQSLSVLGAVSASTIPLQYAHVTFIEVGDATNQVSGVTDTSGRYVINLTARVEAPSPQPTKFGSEQNYSNPFSSTTAISYKLNID